jgi:hypothetical protein
MRRFAVLLAFLCTGVAAEAADFSNQLRGLRTLNVFIFVTEEGEKCGLKKEAVSETVMLPLRAYTKMREFAPADQGLPDATLIVNVATANTPQLCAHGISLEVQTTSPIVRARTSAGSR